MLALFSQWLLIAALGQAPPEATLLKAAPANVDVAVRVRGLEATRDDLLAMLKAMNPDWANMAEGALTEPFAQVRQHHGEQVLKSPLIGLLRIGEAGGDGGPPPFAVLLPSDEYKGTLKEINDGKDVELKHQDGDYDEFDGPGGIGSWYAAKGQGYVAVGTSKSVIADIAKKGGKTLDSVLTGSAAKSFFGGDIGVYVNAASLTTRFAEQIEQARQTFMAALDQAAQQQGNAAAMQLAKELYGAMFDSLKYADGLTLDIDLTAKGAHLAGFLKVKADTDLAKSITEVRSSSLASLGQLPPGEMGYTYMNVGAKTFDRFQGMSLKMIANAGKPSPELEKAMAELHGVGRIESLGSASVERGMRSFSDIKTADPKKFIDASIAILRAMSGGEGALYKDLKVEPSAQTYQGIAFTRVSASVNVEKLAEVAGNLPGQLDMMKNMFGDGQVSYWYGTDGKQVFHAVTPKWEDAKASLDAYLKGDGGIGQTSGYKAVRSALPEQASLMMIFNTQNLLRMYVNLVGTLTKNPDLKAPADLPKEPAFVGASLTPHASEGYEVHLVVPSAVGDVIAKLISSFAR
jgi:hypothetical protein